MITVAVKSGQMGNQLLTKASALSLALEYKKDLCFLSTDDEFFDFFKLESELVKECNITYKRSKSINGLVKIINIFERVTKINLNSNPINLRENKPFLMTKWSYKDDEIFVKHLNEIRSYFAFDETIDKKCSEIINQIRKKSSKLIAVHFRRGDYKNFHNGIWYYSEEDYIRWMKSLYQIDSDIVFVIFTNEAIDQSKLDGAEIPYHFMQGSAIEDLCCMSKVDYIMGPPSTYSWWASVIGNVRRCPIDQKEAIYTFKDFMFLEERVLKNKNLY